MTTYADTSTLQYSGSVEFRPHRYARETVFSVPRRSTAIDVFIDPRGNRTFTNGTVHLFVTAGGVEFEAARARLRPDANGVVQRGPVLRYRGTGDYRIAFSGGELANASDAAGIVGYEAWGATSHSPALALPEDRTPVVSPLWLWGHSGTPASVRGLVGRNVNGGAPFLDGFGPSYLRQAAVTMTDGTIPMWALLMDDWSNEIAATSANADDPRILAVGYFSAPGAFVNFDFRDPHQAATGNDGLYFRKGPTLVFSSISPAAGWNTSVHGGAQFRWSAELRRLAIYNEENQIT